MTERKSRTPSSAFSDLLFRDGRREAARFGFPCLELSGQSHIQAPIRRAHDAVPAQVPNRAQWLRSKRGDVEVPATGASVTSVGIRQDQVRSLMTRSGKRPIGAIRDRKRHTRLESIEPRQLPPRHLRPETFG